MKDLLNNLLFNSRFIFQDAPAKTPEAQEEAPETEEEKPAETQAGEAAEGTIRAGEKVTAITKKDLKEAGITQEGEIAETAEEIFSMPDEVLAKLKERNEVDKKKVVEMIKEYSVEWNNAIGKGPESYKELIDMWNEYNDLLATSPGGLQRIEDLNRSYLNLVTSAGRNARSTGDYSRAKRVYAMLQRETPDVEKK